MSKYNDYARELDNAFKTARTAYIDAYNKLQDAKNALDESKEFRKEKKVGENEIIRKKAELEYSQAKQEFEDVQRTAWPGYESTVKKLTSELDKAIQKDNVASPDALDENGLKLLESGVMSADDYADMLQRYDNNPTMLKIVGKHAEQRANELEGTEQAIERGKLFQIAHIANNGHNSVRRNWDTIVRCAETYSGQKRPHSEPGFVCKMSEHWDEPNMQDAIDSF